MSKKGIKMFERWNKLLENVKNRKTDEENELKQQIQEDKKEENGEKEN